MKHIEHRVWQDGGNVNIGGVEAPYHYQIFETRKELEAFISELRKMGEKVFGRPEAEEGSE